MRTLFALAVLLASLAVSTASPLDEDLRRDAFAKVSPRVYTTWKRQVEKADGKLSKEQQVEMLKDALNTVAAAPAAPPPPVKKAAGVMPADAPKIPYLVGKPGGPTIKPVLGSSYNGYWMLMAHNDGEEPKWIFVEDGVKRTFTKSYIDLSDDPYDGPDFKHIKLSIPSKASVGSPTADDAVPPVAAATPIVADPFAGVNNNNPFNGFQNPGFQGGFPNNSSSGSSPFTQGGGIGSNGLNGLNGNDSSGSGTPITIDVSNKNKNDNTNTNKNKNNNANTNGNTNGNGNKNGNSSGNGKSGTGKKNHPDHKNIPVHHNQTTQIKNHAHDHPYMKINRRR